MSKGLEALKIIDNKTTIRYVYEKEYNTIEKELKALEIIKKSVKENGSFIKLRNGDSMIRIIHTIKSENQEEFDLLKEVLGDE